MNNPQLSYDTVIETNGIKIPFVPEIITPAIAGPMRRNRYEGAECNALRRVLRPGDRVLELGAGIGLLSTVAGQTKGVEKVIAVEANPDLIPMIHETHRLNNIAQGIVIHGIAAGNFGEQADFYLRENFWSSSMEPDSRPYLRHVQVPVHDLSALIAEHAPTVLVCDIEGGEYDLLDHIDTTSLRAIIMEFHPRVYGSDHVARMIHSLEEQGLIAVPVAKSDDVRCFIRDEQMTPPVLWPPQDPRFFISTCMKDEGPFILEWVAWHKAIGIQDIVVFTNDCSDGTDLILDRLEAMGHLRHLPNPAVLTGSTYYQPAALAYTPHLSEWQRADFFISIDVDEFINVRVGQGHMADLLGAVGPFDALSMAELNHGSNNHLHFEPGLVTEQFPRHQGENPGARKALRGVKTITRVSDKLDKPRNHRPDFRDDAPPPIWRDGSGRRIDTLAADPSLNGIDVRGRYDLVVLDHFPLRSLDSYLIKMLRGDVVVKSHRVSRRYWRLRNRNEKLSSDFTRQKKAFQAFLQRLHGDRQLSDLHQEACSVHHTRAKQLREVPEFQERRQWILENAWDVEE